MAGQTLTNRHVGMHFSGVEYPVEQLVHVSHDSLGFPAGVGIRVPAAAHHLKDLDKNTH